MTNALGNQYYIRPIELDGDYWIGQIRDSGAIAQKFSTLKNCDVVTYNKSSIIKTENFEGTRVHVVTSENVELVRNI